nr:DUF2304 domain-containing protein [uncultured Bacillus sp.]
MITLRLQLTLIILSLLTFLLIINLIKKYNLELKYSLLWIFFCVINILLAFFTQIGTFIADLLSIKEPVNAIFLLASIFQFALIFSLTLTISRLSGKVSQLVQEVGVLKNKVEKMQK